MKNVLCSSNKEKVRIVEVSSTMTDETSKTVLQSQFCRHR